MGTSTVYCTVEERRSPADLIKLGNTEMIHPLLLVQPSPMLHRLNRLLGLHSKDILRCTGAGAKFLYCTALRTQLTTV
jgi:hypothetical protein